MTIIHSLKNSLSSHFEKKREQREFENKLRREAEANQRQIFAEEYKKAAYQASLIKARRDAETKTGLAKLRAINTLHNAENRPSGNAFSKLSEYTRANLARREQALAKTQALRQAALEERQKRLNQNQLPRRSLY